MSKLKERTLKNFNPKLDLKLERVVDVPVEKVWEAWTTPKHIKEWFCPKPWKVTDCELELYPGGKFYTLMEGPEGDKHPGTGCYLEIIENQKLAWTDNLAPGFRPHHETNPHLQFHFSGIILLEPEGSGTRYTAIAIHSQESFKQQHDEMGFTDGWSTALDQLVEYMKKQ